MIDAARPIAAPVREHDVSRVDSFTDGGTVEHVSAPSTDALSATVRECVDEHGEVFLLARTNRQAGKIAWALREDGLPYLDVSPSGSLRRWDYPTDMLLAGARGFNAGNLLPIPTLALLLDSSVRAGVRADVQEAIAAAGENDVKRATAVADAAGIRPGSLIRAETYWQWYPKADDGRQLVGQLAIEDWRHELLVDAIESRAIHAPADVRVGTIHTAKGLGAPCVLVFPGYSSNQLDRYHEERAVEAEERRLFYVAMTRASDTALVVHDYLGGEEFPPLAR